MNMASGVHVCCQCTDGEKGMKIIENTIEITSDDKCETCSSCSCSSEPEFALENLPIHLSFPESEQTREFIGSSLVTSRPNEYGDIDVANSRRVIIGNVTYVTGPVYITQTACSVQQQTIVNQLSENHSANGLSIISRLNWLAQPPRTKTLRPKPVQYVIIGHTQTEQGVTVVENTRILRCIQAYHIRCRRWDDIAYNFMVGCDGRVYEGRGWTRLGAHTLGLNHKSICIVFIGDFAQNLPPPRALAAARALITCGVGLGHIPADYTLVGHCQLRPFDSPGRPIFEEIKTWPRWRDVEHQQQAESISFFEFLNSERTNLEV